MSQLTQLLSKMSPLKIALAVEQLGLKRELVDADPIAIIGMGCRLPGGVKTPAEYWQLLSQGVHTVTEIPSYRWAIDDYYDPDPSAVGKMTTRYGSFIGAVDGFDSAFFGISPREAANLDPQQRLLLEVSWTALEHAHIVPEQLLGKSTGVFLGITSHDYTNLLFSARNLNYIDAYMGSGHSLSVAAGRLSYTLGLTGPSLVVDTACSSSLVAVHLACQSLRHRECSLALVGGVQLNLSPEFFITFSKARMLSADGRCKTFDAKADGYARGEGCGVIVLKRLAEAVREGDSILAIIRSSSVNQDGRSSGLTVPNGPAQQAVIRQALDRGGIEPESIDYIEAHGTGTSLGDPIEIGALAQVFKHSHTAENPLWVGSVKTNLGHLEGAAGIAGLMKVVLSLQQEQIPPHLHFTEPNPHIAWETAPIAIPTQLQTWARGEKRRLAGVSAFGFSGTNAHLILEEAPQLETTIKSTVKRPYHLLTLSAKTPAALEALIPHYQSLTEPLEDIAYSSNLFRSHFKYRTGIVATTQTDLQQTPTLTGREIKKIAFLFTGQGSQYVGMSRQLYETQETFKEIIEQCHELLKSQLEQSLLSILYPETGHSSPLDETAYTQPGIFAVGYALAKLWQSWGISPDFVMGHSVGEYVAACIAGVFSVEDGLKLVTARGRLMQTHCERGMMLAVSLEGHPELVEAYPELVEGKITSLPELVEGGFHDSVSTGSVSTGSTNVHRACPTYPELVEGKITSLPELVEGGFYNSVSTGSTNVHRACPAYPELVEGKTTSLPELVEGGFHDSVSTGSVSTGSTNVHRACPTFPELVEGKTTSLPELVEGKITLAAINGSESIVLSGTPSAITSLNEILIEKGLKTKFLAVSHAFHSPMMEPMIAPFRQVAQTIRYQPPKIPIISNVTGQLITDFSADYWCEHIRQPVQFARSIATLQEQGVNTFMEMGAKPILLGMARQCVAEDFGVWLPSLRPGQADWQVLLESLKTLYESGISVDWTNFNKDYHFKRVDLPTYPFQRQSYWFSESIAVPPNLPVMSTQFADYFFEIQWQSATLGELSLSPDFYAALIRDSEAFIKSQNLTAYQDFLSRLEALCVGYVAKALTKNLAVLPQYDRLLNRLQQILAKKGDERDISILGSESVEFTLLDRCGSALSAVLSGQCNPLELIFPQGDLTAATHFYQNTPIAKAMNGLVAEVVAKAVQQRFVRILEIGAGTGGTTAHILPKLAPDRSVYVFTDVSAHFLNQAQVRFKDYPFVKYEIFDVEQSPSMVDKFDIIICAHVLHATRDLRQSLFHIQQLLTPSGFLVLLDLEGERPSRMLDLIFGLTPGWWRFEDIALRPDYPLLSTSQWQALLSEVGFARVSALSSVWPMTLLVAQRSVLARQWLVVTDDAGLEAQLIARFASRGDRCTAVSPDKLSLLEGMAWDEVVFLPGVLGEVVSNALFYCECVLRWVQALHKARVSPRLWLVTRGVDETISHAPLWGMGKAIALEYPDLRCICLDIVAEHPEAFLAFLEGELYGNVSENLVRYYQGQRQVARLVQSSVVEKPYVSVRSDGSYLITGGLGGLGFAIAQWLVLQGAKYLVLLGRTAEPNAQVAQLTQQGVHVEVVSVDVTDYGAMQAVFSQVVAQLPPLRGVIHAVGVLDDGLMVEQEWAKFARVLKPKVAGAWYLHELVLEYPLDFFVLFSSAVSLIGSSGQASHCAGNAFLDGLAHYRRARGLPALSINWGPWAEIGAAARYQARQQERGVRALSPEEGVACFSYLLNQTDLTQIGVFSVDWVTFLQNLPVNLPLLANFAEATHAISQTDEPTEVFSMDKSQLTTYLAQYIAKTLRLSELDTELSLTEVGLDSLMAVEIRNFLRAQLAVDIPLSTLLKGISVTELVESITLQWSQIVKEEVPQGGEFVEGEL